MNTFPKYSAVIGAALLLMVVILGSGCASLYNRFKPNTMVKEFIVDGDKPPVGAYELTVLMQAKEIGNKTGVDDYRIVLQLRSKDAVESSDDSLALPIPRFSTLTIISDSVGTFRADLDKERIGNKDLTVRPQIFRNHYLEYFDIRDVHVPDEIARIKIDAAVSFYNRQTLAEEDKTTISISLYKRQSIEWYDPAKAGLNDELEGLESYRGSKIND